MISIKNEQEIELMRKSGEITYGALMGLKDFIKPGVTTKEIDFIVEKLGKLLGEALNNSL